MSWWGKVVGGAFGFLLGGPLGALFGAAVGHHFDKGLNLQGLDAPGGSDPNQARVQAAFFTATFAVMGRVAKADGRVTPDEISHARQVMQSMHLNAEQTRVAEDLFRAGKQESFDLDAVISQLVRECRRRRTLLQMFLEIQIQAALSDDELHPGERALLERIATRLGLGGSKFEQLVALVQGARAHARSAGRGASDISPAEARRILGVEDGAGQDDIKRAYRRLMNQHHPDKLIARGMPEEMVRGATERSQEIRRAYERLKAPRKKS